MNKILLVIIILLIFISCNNYKGDESELKKMATTNTYQIDEQLMPVYEKKARNGSSKAAFDLYQHYLYSETDKQKERYWLEIAAKLGHPVAQHNLAFDLFFLNKDKQGAIYWAKKAYKNGNSNSKILLEEIQGRE